jgi:hypothetical protein
MTVNFPSGRSTSIPLRLFWRAPRISMQSFCAEVTTRFLFPIFEPTKDSPELRGDTQIFPRERTPLACSGRPLAERFRSVEKPVSMCLHDMAQESLDFGQRPKTARGPRALPGNVRRVLQIKPGG